MFLESQMPEELSSMSRFSQMLEKVWEELDPMSSSDGGKVEIVTVNPEEHIVRLVPSKEDRPEDLLEEAARNSKFEQMRKQVLPATRLRSRLVKITDFKAAQGAILKFTTRSVSNTKIRYEQTVKFDSWDLIKEKEISYSEKIKEALNGDIKVECNCPDFGYRGYAYMLAEQGAKFGPDDTWNKVSEVGGVVKKTVEDVSKPVITNPQQKGICCKHLTLILDNLETYVDKMAKSEGGFRKVTGQLMKKGRAAPKDYTPPTKPVPPSKPPPPEPPPPPEKKVPAATPPPPKKPIPAPRQPPAAPAKTLSQIAQSKPAAKPTTPAPKTAVPPAKPPTKPSATRPVNNPRDKDIQQ